MKIIVVALDFSDLTPVVLTQSAELARVFDANLFLIHTMDPGPNYAMYGFSPAEFPINPLDNKLRAAVESRLQELAVSTKLPASKVHTVAILANPVDGILSYAKEIHADLLVLGAHGHGFLSTMILGSVAQGIVRRAELPTLIVPRGD